MKKKVILAQLDDDGQLEVGELDPAVLNLSPDAPLGLSDKRATELEKIYARLREQVNAENQLYTQRIYWLIFIQAFLFATIGLVLQAILDPNAGPLNGFLISFMAVIALLGMFVGLVCHYIFSGARNSMNELGEMWSEAVAEAAEEGEARKFPHVRGGTQKNPKRHNWLFRSGYLGLAFVAAWMSLAILAYVYLLRPMI